MKSSCGPRAICPFRAKSGDCYSEKRGKLNAVTKRNDSNCVGILSDQGEAAAASNLCEYAIPVILHTSLLTSSVVLKMFLMFDLNKQLLHGLSKASRSFFSYSYACLDKVCSSVVVQYVYYQTAD